MEDNMTTFALSTAEQNVQAALSIPKMSHAEAGKLAKTEYQRLLSLVESLEGKDWEQQTYCTEWRVRELVAHLAGACAAFASWDEFKRQMIQNPYRKDYDMQVDAINKCQVEDRAGRSEQELVAEFREKTPKAIQTRQRLPWLLRHLPVPFGPPLGTKPVQYLTDTIYTRDEWMHRYDICAATGKMMETTPEHDGRLMDLNVLELGQRLKSKIGGRTIDLMLTGDIEGAYRFGGQDEPGAALEIDVYDFNLLASGRITADEAASRVKMSGNRADASWFLSNIEIPY
jgi:uncharacterized protein (TIGR03083 family)